MRASSDSTERAIRPTVIARRASRSVVARSVRRCCLTLRPGRRGVTLLEVLLSMTLIILMMSGIFGYYSSVLRVRKEGTEIAKDVLLTRAILERITDELRHAVDIVPGDGMGFRGDKHSITIVRSRMPENYAYLEYDDMVMEDLPPAQLDLIRIRYELLWDDEEVDEEGVALCHGLWRTQQKVFDPNPQFVVAQDAESMAESQDEEVFKDIPQPEGELYAPEIKYLRFKYYDGVEWRDQWQVQDDTGGVDMGKPAASGKETYALPQAVRITIGRVREDPLEEPLSKDEEERDEQEVHHPDRFTIVVHILQSDPSLITSRKYGVADQLGRSSEGVE